MSTSTTRATVLALLGAVVALAPIPPATVDRWFSGWFFPSIQPVVTGVANSVPWPLFDVALVAFVACVGIVVIGAVRAHTGSRRRRAGRAAVALTALAAGVYLWFALLWGVNYRRTPIEGRLVRAVPLVHTDAVLSLGTRAAAALNRLHGQAHAEGWDQAEWRDARLRAGFAATLRALGHARPAEPGRLKHSLVGPYFRWTGVDGMVSPFTLEVLANPDLLPFERPFVAAHEWGHLAGYADEAEASFVGWVVCMHAGVPAQYSGWLFLLWQVRGELSAATRAGLDAALVKGPRDGMAAVAERLRRGTRPQLRRASWAAYDQYLKANRVEEGVRSYSRVLELLATTSFDDDWTPEIIKAQGPRPKAQGQD